MVDFDDSMIVVFSVDAMGYNLEDRCLLRGGVCGGRAAVAVIGEV